jgi:hypothetical protein
MSLLDLEVFFLGTAILSNPKINNIQLPASLAQRLFYVKKMKKVVSIR